MERAKIIQYVRIAVTALSLMACVLCIALWVRSNWYVDEVWFPLPGNRGLGFVSAENCGSIGIQKRESNPSSYIVGYNSVALPIVDYELRTFPGFFLTLESDVAYLNVPYWFLVLLSALAAVCAWTSWQFSLRTMLIATTLVAVGLGVIVLSR